MVERGAAYTIVHTCVVNTEGCASCTEGCAHLRREYRGLVWQVTMPVVFACHVQIKRAEGRNTSWHQPVCLCACVRV